MSTHHEVLGVSADATPEQVRLAFQRLAAKYHPDRPEADSDKFDAVKKAYEYLKNRICPTCFNKGFIMIPRGIFVTKQNCPTCWKNHG